MYSKMSYAKYMITQESHVNAGSTFMSYEEIMQKN